VHVVTTQSANEAVQREYEATLRQIAAVQGAYDASTGGVRVNEPDVQ
jgi:hypothetical protein